MAKLDGKVAIISGSGRGIGRAIALKLAGEGACVVVNDLDAEPADDTAAAIRGLGGEAAVCAGDVTEADFGDRFVALRSNRSVASISLSTTPASPGTAPSRI